MSQEKFQIAYQGLNSKQKQAVDTVYGPLMVIAGPGTGKTQLLSTRVGRILRDTDYRPFNILCLTYTTSGVAAMKQRLVELIGSEGNDVEIFTFHSFAEKIIQRYSRYQDVESFQFINEIDQKILVRSLLEDIEFNTPLKKTISSIDSSIRFVQTVISQIKKEKYDAESLIHALHAELKDKKNSDEYYYKKSGAGYKAGDFYQSKWDKFEHKLTKNIQALEIYKKYATIIKEKKWMDYEDMLLNALSLLTNEDDLRYDLQEQYQVIMVDEFQDTSGAQLELIHQLCRDTEDPNIMVVGDEDQSIYRFQGANLYNIFDFHDRYLATKSVEEQMERVVVLEKNYRSTPVILEASSMLIRNNEERITHLVKGKTLLKKLEAEHPSLKKSIEPVDIIEVENKEDEYIPLALKIEQLVSSGVSYKDIAVLFPTNDQMTEFSNYLSALEFPFEMSKDENILDDRLVQSYIQIIRFILDFSQRKVLSPEGFADLLMHPWIQLSLYDISSFWAAIKALQIKSPLDFLQFMENFNQEDRVAQTIAIYRDCVQKLQLMTPHRWFHYVLDSFHIKEWALSQVNRLEILQKIEVLEKFLVDYLLQMEKPNIQDFVSRIEDYEREAIAIPFVRRYTSDDSIKLMTYHKSKGLEFDYVFVFKAGRHRDKPRENLYVPEELIAKNLRDDEEKNRTEEEKRRLLYVAMTRAKKKLYLTDIVTDETSKTKNKFKQELNPVSEQVKRETPDIAAPVISSVYRLTEQDYLRFAMLNQNTLNLREEALFENEYIEKKLKDFKLSHSTLNTYLECPQKFYIEKIISVPTEPSFQMAMGSFYHSVLENFDRMIEDNSSKDTLADLISMAMSELYLYKSQLTDMEFKNIQQALNTNLPLLYEQYLSKTKVEKYELEKTLEMRIGDAIFTGTLDKIVWDGNSITILDYKTGKLSNANSKKKLLPFNPELILTPESTVDEQYGGNYWRQAVIYAMLIQSNFADAIIKEIKYVFILPEDGKINSVNIQISPSDMLYMKNLIMTNYTKIQNKEFNGCTKIDCPQCSKVAFRQSFNV